MSRYLGSYIAAISCLSAIASSAAQAQSVEEAELEKAKSAWTQCVQSQRDVNGLPPSSGFFGPRFEVRTYSNVQCKAQMERTRAALTASENAAGRQASEKAIGRLMDDMKHGMAASLLPPDPSRVIGEPSISTVDAAASPATSPLTCKGSVKRGLEAYNAGNYETAFCYWWPKALKGDAAAQNNIGLLFENGSSSSTPQSNDKAAEWYLASARQGLVLGMRNLARVQQRLGYSEAANSWLTMASTTEAQQAQQQYQVQQNLNSSGYALGCALAGGCAPPVARPTPAPVVQTKPPKCEAHPYMKDTWGNPQIVCRAQ